MSEAALYVALSKKSNASYLAISKAQEDVRNLDSGDIPMHLRNAPIDAMKDLGYKEGYLYPHDFENHMVEQQYLPEQFKDKKYFEPDNTQIKGEYLVTDFGKDKNKKTN